MPKSMKRRATSTAPQTQPTPLPSGVESDLVTSLERAPRVHGIDDKIARLESLVRAEGRRPVLVGPPEAGKSAIVWGLARRIAAGARPAGASAIWEVSLRSLDIAFGKADGAGARFAQILRDAAAAPEKPIVYVSDLRMLRSVDAQHAFVEALAHTRVAVIGEAWPGYSAWLADDAELAAVTHVMRVDEATADATRAMLRADVPAIERSYGVRVRPDAIDEILRYSERLQTARRFPGKAFALLDEVAREAMARDDRTVSAAVVTDRVCESLRLPRFLVDPATPFDADGLRTHLRNTIVGQDDAIEAVVERLALYKADLCDPARPLGVLLFAGPPGVGKSQIALEVASYVFGSPRRLARISLADHSEDWKVDQLFGTRTSQTLDGRRGALARHLSGKPFSVLLLDEVEKAHPLAFKQLLRPLDEGFFVNGNDDEVSLRNTLVIMTSNVGADAFRESGLGFTRADGVAHARLESARKRVEDSFPTDLLDRVDRVCVCPPLAEDNALLFARRELDRALARATARHPDVRVEVRDSVLRAILAESGGDAMHGSGARALRRVLEQRLVAPLALRLVARSALRDHIVLEWRDGSITIAPSVDAGVRTAATSHVDDEPRAPVATPRRPRPAPRVSPDAAVPAVARVGRTDVSRSS
jgi:ATP-dependent Clp protease ATP-binding subunit ClpA